jgi:hypothetical protein
MLLCLVSLISAATMVSGIFSISTDRSTYTFGETIQATITYDISQNSSQVKLDGWLRPQGETSFLGPFDATNLVQDAGSYNATLQIPIPFGYSPGTWALAVAVSQQAGSTQAITTLNANVTVLAPGGNHRVPVLPMAPAILGGIVGSALIARRRRR